MCGLFGWVLSDEAVQECDLHALATILAYNANNRGDESWGVVKVVPGVTPVVTKDIGSIRVSCRVKDILAPIVIGHTRKATTGKVSQENAHPFAHGSILGAHNGFIWDHEGLNKEHNREFQVDSQHLIAHIAEGKPITELGGSGTVSYINIEHPEVVHLGRGQGSDLVVFGIGKPEKPRGIVWASIHHWLKDALSMAGFKETFEFNTHLQELYKIERYDLFKAGDFPLGPSRSRMTQITRNDGMGTGNRLYPTYPGYRGRTLFDDKSYDKDKQTSQSVREMVCLSKSEVDDLPEHLKKKIKKSVAWRKGKQRRLLKQLGDVMHVKIGERWLTTMRQMLGG